MDELRAKMTAFFTADPRAANLVAVYLFGSTARGTAAADSDVDVGVLYRTAPRPTLLDQPFDVTADLSETLGRQVDMVVMNSAPVDLVKRILRDGEILIERDRSARIAFEVRARNEYFDLLPILRLYRRQAARS
jgi:predicted nucleotidyltransferase